MLVEPSEVGVMVMLHRARLWLALRLLPEGWAKINGRIVELEPFDKVGF